MTAATATSTVGIQPGVVYPLADFQQVSKFGKHAMRTARRKGLRVRYVGGRAFVSGDDFISYLDRLDNDGDS